MEAQDFNNTRAREQYINFQCTNIMKQLLLAILLMTSTWGASAQNAKQEQRSYSVYFAVNKWEITNDLQFVELAKILNELNKHPEAKISIVGWADKTGNDLANKVLSIKRAGSVKSYFRQNGIAAERIVVVNGEGADYEAIYNTSARRTDITLTFFVQQEPVEQPKEEQTVSVVEQVEIIEPIPVKDPTPVPTARDLFSLRTNILYWIGGVPNIGIELMVSESVGILVNGGWSPWSSNNNKFNWVLWFVSPELRVYMGQKKSWFVGAQFLLSDYNLKPKDIGSQGYAMAGGITGGYKIRLSESIDMDLSLGLGYGQLKYDSYLRGDNGVNVFTEKGVTKTGFMPTQLGVSLIWKIK